MIETPLYHLIENTRNRWLYKSNTFYYPYKFGIEDDELSDNFGNFSFECVCVNANTHENNIGAFPLENIFDAVFLGEHSFEFLNKIEAKHMLAKNF